MAVVHFRKWHVLLASAVVASCSKPKPPEPTITEPAPTTVEPTPEPAPLVPETPPAPEATSSTVDAALKTVYFEYDSSAITADSKDALATLAEALKGSSDRIQIAGHCDERGTPEYNMGLGEQRASAVKSYLVSQGVPADRLTTISFGKEKPAVEGHDESAWSKNRRAEFTKL